MSADSENPQEIPAVNLATMLIDESPYCVWGRQIDSLDREFIDGIDPAYFEYTARAHEAGLEGDEAQRAAMAIRLTYSHAQETLMSLLGAFVQSPHCIIGWLHKYRNEELDEVVRKISNEVPVPNRWGVPTFSWDTLSRLVHRTVVLEDKDKQERIVRDFGHFWSRIARDFLDDNSRREYNSIKHGLRARSGGFTLAIGKDITPGVPANFKDMRSLGGSRFGSTYYVPEAIQGVEKCNLRILSRSSNWLPELLIKRIQLMSLSMNNVLSHLKMGKGRDPKECEFSWPEDMGYFAACWNKSPGVTNMSFNLDPVGAQDIAPMTKKAIVDRYKNPPTKSDTGT